MILHAPLRIAMDAVKALHHGNRRNLQPGFPPEPRHDSLRSTSRPVPTRLRAATTAPSAAAVRAPHQQHVIITQHNAADTGDRGRRILASHDYFSGLPCSLKTAKTVWFLLNGHH